MDLSGITIIDDASDLPVGPTGYAGWSKPGEPHAFSAPRPVGSTIPRSQWKQLIQEGQGSFLSDLVKQQGIKPEDQGQTPLCWANGCTMAVKVRRAAVGLAFRDLSPESVAAPVTGGRYRGGYASEAFNQIEKGGICEKSFLDSPHSLSTSRWKSGWQENAALHKATSWYQIGTSYDEVITCLLNRIPVAAGLDWWGHLVCFLDPVLLPDGSVGVLFYNSWGLSYGDHGMGILTERKATPDGAAAPVHVEYSEK